MLWQIQADGTSAPEASTSLGPTPRLPSPPPGPCPGCLCRVEPSSPGSGEAAGTVPIPWAGRLAGAGRGQLEQDSRPGSSITLGCRSGFEGVSWKEELDISVHAEPAMEAVGRRSTGLGVLSPSL